MDVVAISTPRDAGWRWRILSYSGEVVEESHRLFSTIRHAVEEGALRLHEMNVADVARAKPGDRFPDPMGRRSTRV